MCGDDEELRDLCFLPKVISETRDRRIMWHVWGRTELRTEFWWESLKESDGLGDQDIGLKPL